MHAGLSGLDRLHLHFRHVQVLLRLSNRQEVVVIFSDYVVVLVDAQLEAFSLLLGLDSSHVDVELPAELLKDTGLLIFFCLFDGILEHDEAGLFEERLPEDVLLGPHTLTYFFEVLQTLVQHCSGFVAAGVFLLEDVGLVELLADEGVEVRVVPAFLDTDEQQHVKKCLEHGLLIVADHLHILTLAIKHLLDDVDGGEGSYGLLLLQHREGFQRRTVKLRQLCLQFIDVLLIE